MTKYLISAVVVVMLAIRGAGYLASVPSRRDVYASAQVIYTSEIPGYRKAYAFWYDTGALGYTIRMVSLGKPSHEQAIIQSAYINGVHWIARDTLVVELWKNEYTMTNDRTGVVIIPRVTPE